MTKLSYTFVALLRGPFQSLCPAQGKIYSQGSHILGSNILLFGFITNLTMHYILHSRMMIFCLAYNKRMLH